MSAIYDSSYIGTPTNRIVLNNFKTYPVFLIEDILPPRFQIRESTVPIPEMSGIADFNDYIGKTVMVLQGEMFVNSEAQYYAGRQQLRNLGSMEISQNDPSSDMGYVPYVWQEAGQGRQLFVKIEYADGLGESSANGFTQSFRLILTIKNPKIFGTTVVSASLNTAPSAGPLGGATIPAHIDMQIGSIPVSGTSLPFTLPVVLGSVPSSSGGTVNNSGSLYSYPTTTIYGPINKPRVTNLTTGEYIEIDTQLQPNESILISYDEDTAPSVTGPGGINLYNKLSAGYTFFRVKPGVNNFSLTGSALGAGSYALVNFLPAYALD